MTARLVRDIGNFVLVASLCKLTLYGIDYFATNARRNFQSLEIRLQKGSEFPLDFYWSSGARPGHDDAGLSHGRVRGEPPGGASDGRVWEVSRRARQQSDRSGNCDGSEKVTLDCESVLRLHYPVELNNPVGPCEVKIVIWERLASAGYSFHS